MKPRTIALAIPTLLLGGVIGFLLRTPNEPTPTPATTASPHAQQLHALFDADWERQLELSPTRASMLGDRRWNDRWPDLSEEARAKAIAEDRAALAELQTIDRSTLTPTDQLNYDLFEQGKQLDIEEAAFDWHLVALNQRGGVQTRDELADALRFETDKDFEDWTLRLEAFPEYLAQNQALLERGIATGMLLPKVVMQRIPAQIDKQVVDAPTDSPFFAPFRDKPERTEIAERAKKAIADGIVPAFRKFRAFFTERYLPACPEEPGAWKLPNGDKLYTFFARQYTTTDQTPDEIHAIGLGEVARIRTEMEQVKTDAGFEGELAAFFEYLRTDPKFFYQSGADLLAGYESMSRRIDPLMVRVFKRLPRMPYGILPIPDKIAPDTTTAYYRRPAADGSRPGGYFVNLFKPESRPKWEMMALSLHEAVPGHHLQIALAMELGELPQFRRNGGYTAFIEGWGLYSEYLGEELGLYEDPYDKFGQLTYEMWRAVRLVVDTGIHHKRWSRQQAIDFFVENAPKSELDIVNEIDRYIAWPGQALAYKIGELRIKELRRRAEQRLGDKFDVREFHEAILRNGAVPLDVLERLVDDWLRAADAT